MKKTLERITRHVGKPYPDIFKDSKADVRVTIKEPQRTGAKKE